MRAAQLVEVGIFGHAAQIFLLPHRFSQEAVAGP
jgi:hypothetical protein